MYIVNANPFPFPFLFTLPPTTNCILNFTCYRYVVNMSSLVWLLNPRECDNYTFFCCVSVGWGVLKVCFVHQPRYESGLGVWGLVDEFQTPHFHFHFHFHALWILSFFLSPSLSLCIHSCNRWFLLNTMHIVIWKLSSSGIEKDHKKKKKKNL